MEVRARFEDAPFKDFCPIRIGDRIRAVEEVGLDSLENPRSVYSGISVVATHHAQKRTHMTHLLQTF